MAEPKKPGNPLSLSGNLITQLLFGLFISLVLGTTLGNVALSIFLGVLGSLAVGWFTTVNATNPQAETVASTEGIDAGLKYWLFFLLCFSVLGYQPSMSIFLGAIAGGGAGWTIAWWKSNEESRTQLPDESEDTEADLSTDAGTTRRRKRKASRRYRRGSGFPSFRFWRR